jgi:hypothetical protein
MRHAQRFLLSARTGVDSLSSRTTPNADVQRADVDEGTARIVDRAHRRAEIDGDLGVKSGGAMR